MEQRRTCKLCLKSFSNGRALGGHMRSHMVTLQPHHHPPTPPKIQLGHQQQQQLRDIETTESASSYSTEDEGEELCYGLRENPKKNFRLVDPEFSFGVLHDAGSSVVVHDVQDRESETESSKNPILRIRRSKRNRMKSGSSSSAAAATTTTTTTTRFINQNQPKLKKAKSSKPAINKAYHEFYEPEPVSSVSDTTPEEDVALCLMMLSRASWDSKQQVVDEDEEDDQKSKSIEEDQSDDDDDDDDESLEEEEEEELKIVPSRNRAKYQCGTCKKVFRSYQALGGHRASHKKIRGCNTSIPQIEEVESELGGNVALPNTSNPVIDRKIHECPVCFRVFGSGQALGGHKRSHGVGVLSGSTSTNVNRGASIKFGHTLIDLNLPAPIEDDDYSQIELSAVSDAEFIDPIK